MTQVQIFSKPEPVTATIASIPLGTYFWGRFPDRIADRVKLYLLPDQNAEDFFYVLDVEAKEIVGVYGVADVQDYTPVKRVEVHANT